MVEVPRLNLEKTDKVGHAAGRLGLVSRDWGPTEGEAEAWLKTGTWGL